MDEEKLIAEFKEKQQFAMTQEDQAVRAWYCPKTRGYRFFLPNGEEIPLLFNCSVTLDDNWMTGFWEENYRHHLASAKISLVVKIVNEIPVKND